MIFVTVGTQLPFDRMIRTVDYWAGRHGRDDVFAQVGPTSVQPQHIAFSGFLDTREFHQRVVEASVVIAHAGMGSILTALEMGKPIIVMPRRADLFEHRNDHQMATARQLLAQGRVHVAFDERELEARLEAIDALPAPQRISPHASPQLIGAIRDFIATGSRKKHSNRERVEAPLLQSRGLRPSSLDDLGVS